MASFGMKMTISMISKKFGSVKDINTETLHDWTKNHVIPSELSLKHNISGDKGNFGDENTEGTSSDQQVQDTSDARRKLVILDCRPDEEYVISHLEGSVRVDFDKDVDQIVKSLPEYLQPVENLANTDIVCYCSLGYRSSIVADKFQKYLKENSGSLPSGPEFPAAVNLEGSLFKWANEGRHMVDSNGQKTNFAHPYSVVWGKLLHAELRKEKL
ncbi:uncharacterized protein LOC132548475 [Ylistrum balloti]|uniref:uncharacterized protein LOC132548475 n=1 Tax=Ylistrum balloti TaxID=509963 RepID=UPI002905D7E7|nr:uncharacterized protein LOC132548475 [Ylistrum balloti]